MGKRNGHKGPRFRRVDYQRRCDDGKHAVATITTPNDEHRDMPSPCAQCPWRADLPTGEFPPDAFRMSANTSYDQSTHLFGCHMSGTAAVTCAGFLLRGSDNNIGVRLLASQGMIEPGSVTDGGFPLYDSYRAMAEANGVAPDDPALALCRGNDE